ncbi:hypothetical protein SDRG_08525 [Saprolegnia diclina VS20]|uniref:FYVE-type domain-containing protein n=1 Tax=Saprolegnia diclina (strain VS20) TaxID=1156394 RepID=T0Q7J4_SAPDV|nr:hypothetical protein SDRG_08525 [Saprolegnia diclina VS20]EQC33844.1 hypothetical protein SDRG_08525 [Saprolegnia diclina VS20]|eukprot:XP_008612639.1 hypothetical protein SDRG_08525 [Saprolegnia diclina VS20]
MARPTDAPLFRPTSLSDVEAQMLCDIGKNAFSKLLETTRCLRELLISQPDVEHNDLKKRYFAATFNLMGNIDEIADFCVKVSCAGDSSAHRKIAAELFCLEATARLYSIEYPTSVAPYHYIGMRWSHIKSPMRMLLRDRDFCTIEYQDEYIDENGQRGYAMCSHSVEHNACPPLDLGQNYVRSKLFHSGYVFTETDIPNVLKVTLYFDYGQHQKMAHYMLLNTVARHRLQRIERINSLIGSHQPRHVTSSMHSNGGLNTPTKCAMCDKAFSKGLSLFQRKATCCICHSVVCRSCSCEWDVDTGRGLRRDRVCKHCFRDMHQNARRLNDYRDTMSHYTNRYSHGNHSVVDLIETHSQRSMLSPAPSAKSSTSRLTTVASSMAAAAQQHRQSSTQQYNFNHRFQPPKTYQIDDPVRDTRTNSVESSYSAYSATLKPMDRRPVDPPPRASSNDSSRSTLSENIDILTSSNRAPVIWPTYNVPVAVAIAVPAPEALLPRESMGSLCDLSYLNHILTVNNDDTQSSPGSTTSSAASRVSTASRRHGHRRPSNRSNASSNKSDLSYLSTYNSSNY